MSDASSGRNSGNAGSDSRKHYGTSVVDVYQRTPAPGKSTPTTGTAGVVRDLPVGSPKPAIRPIKADSTTAPMASGNVRPSDFE
ncbi:hypothetical protein DR64_3442 [Paraburkholderia xenovorans LB400]|uniref:hypothetical protein n=1 Tax=Paraburkholderia xenovorans TaxID=36873 RepID=UPI0004F85DB2|nr:hypothetical protein [Paraburkholderia xenovorans]AIP31164.1 hypothetical protein DR64_3442 [Paraburkholderia xenovorans LB400]